MKITIVAFLIMALLLAALIFGSEADAQTPAPTSTATPTIEPTDTPKPQKQEEVSPGPVRNLSVSPSNRTLEVSWDAPPLPLFGHGASSYRYGYRASGGSWSSLKTTYHKSVTIGSLTNGRRYQVQVLACNDAGCSSVSSVYGTPVAPTATPTKTPIPLPDPPTRLRISLDSDHSRRIEVSYRRSESPHYYEFELRGSSSENGSYSVAATEDDSRSPVRFSNLTRGRWYKARGRNCLDSSRRNCGDWGAFTSSIELPNIGDPTPTSTPTATPTGAIAATATVTHTPTPTEPPPDTAGCGMTDLGYISVSKTEVYQDEWTTDDCKSPNRKDDNKDSYARYYGFTLAADAEVTITLTSDEDTYLYLLNGIGANGSVARKNDDIDGAANKNSRITVDEDPLPAGKYTIEATTYHSDKVGDYNLTVNISLTQAPPTATPTPTYTPTPTVTVTPAAMACVNPLSTITGQRNLPGTWDDSCLSNKAAGQGSGDRYARFYTFTLDNRSKVQIDLTSGTDTYLYLMQGHGKSGKTLHDNDDIASGNLNSQIEATLAPGDYTIEATTYDAKAAGAFNLAIQVTELATPTPTPTPVCPSGTSSGNNVGLSTCPAPPPAPSCNAVFLASLASIGTRSEITKSGSWVNDCHIGSRDFFRHYRFSVNKGTHVSIEISGDNTIELRKGTSTSGRFLAKGSSISKNLTETGSYTVTLWGRSTGDFTLNIKGKIPWMGGHQKDHTVKYKIGSEKAARPSLQPSNPVKDPATVIPSAIAAAASAWNRAVGSTNPKLLFCKDDSVKPNGSNECLVSGTDKNGDNTDVLIHVVPGNNVGWIHKQDAVLPAVLGANHCGSTYACVKPRGFASQLQWLRNIDKFRWLPVNGKHLLDLTMVIEEPAWSYSPSTSGTGFTGGLWTNDASKHLDLLDETERLNIPGLDQRFVYRWLYAPGVVIHEFGHTAGLTDLYRLTGYPNYLMGPARRGHVKKCVNEIRRRPSPVPIL